MLEGVQAIVERESGAIAAGRTTTINRNIEFVNKNIGLMQSFFTDEADLKTVRDVQDGLKNLADMVTAKLKNLIENSAKEEAQIKNQFEELNRMITEHSTGIQATLNTLIQNRQKEMAASGAELQSAQGESLTLGMGVLGIAVLVLIAVFIWLGASIIRPIKKTQVMLKDIAQGEGDLTARLEIHGRDEIGEMAAWFNTFMEKLQGVIRQVLANVQTLSEAAGRMSSVASNMSDGAEELSAQAGSLSENADHVQKNMNGAAAASEQLSNSVGSMASAVEEMTASIAEISHNASNSARTAESAAHLTPGHQPSCAETACQRRGNRQYRQCDRRHRRANQASGA